MNKRDFLRTSLAGALLLALPRRASALRYYPNPSEKKWAVLYATWCGSSRDAAVWISEGMNGIADALDVRESPDLAAYDRLVIGGSIRSSRVSEELRRFLEERRVALKGKVRGLFAVCNNYGRPPGPEQTATLIDGHLAKLCGVQGVPSRVFLGRVTYGLLDPGSRSVLQSMGIKECDNLRRADCMAFGKELLDTAG